MAAQSLDMTERLRVPDLAGLVIRGRNQVVAMRWLPISQSECRQVTIVAAAS